MSRIALDQHLEQHKPALPDSEFSIWEKTAIWAVLGLIAILLSGFVLANDVVWDEGLKPIIWDPVTKDAGAAGDAGYSPRTQPFIPARCWFVWSFSKLCFAVQIFHVTTG